MGKVAHFTMLKAKCFNSFNTNAMLKKQLGLTEWKRLDAGVCCRDGATGRLNNRDKFYVLIYSPLLSSPVLFQATFPSALVSFHLSYSFPGPLWFVSCYFIFFFISFVHSHFFSCLSFPSLHFCFRFVFFFLVSFPSPAHLLWQIMSLLPWQCNAVIYLSSLSSWQRRHGWHLDEGSV